MQRRIRFDAAFAARCEGGVNGCSKITRQENDDIAAAGSQLRGSAETNIPASGRRVRIDPGRNRAARRSRLHRASYARQANASSAGFHLHWAGNGDHADAASARLRVNRAAHFAKIDLAAAGAHVHKISRVCDGDVATNRLQVGAAANFPCPDMATTSAKRSVSRNIARADVATRGEGRKIPCDIQNLNMPTLRFELCNQAAGRGVAKPGSANPSRADVSTLCAQARRSADVLCFDVADFRVHVNVIAARNSHFKLDPELRLIRTRRLRRERARKFNSKVCGPGPKNVTFQKLLASRAARVRFDVHGLSHDRRCAGLELENPDRAEIGRQPQREPVPGLQSAGPNHGRVRSGHFSDHFQCSGSALWSRSGDGGFLEKEDANNNQQSIENKNPASRRKSKWMREVSHRRTNFNSQTANYCTSRGPICRKAAALRNRT